MPDPKKALKLIEKAGDRIQEICSKFPPHVNPSMLPPIPDSKFVEKLDKSGEGSSVRELGHLQGYEAEVKLYRCFERLERPKLTVLHQLEFTHLQYCAFDDTHCAGNSSHGNSNSSHGNSNSSHGNSNGSHGNTPPGRCKNKPHNRDGECDFIVLGENFVAVFEVKALSLSYEGSNEDKQIAFNSCLEMGNNQRNKMLDLIKSMGCPGVAVRGFVVFVNVSAEGLKSIGLERSEFQDSSSIVLSDNLMRFSDWFENTFPVGDVDPALDNVKTRLLGLWACYYESKGHYKWNEKKCRLPDCIEDVDEKLKQGIITAKLLKKYDQDNSVVSMQSNRQRKRTASEMQGNSSYQGADAQDPIFADVLGVQSLSKYQNYIFKSQAPLLWVNGPAGSGKTMVMLGRILKMMEDGDLQKKVILVCPNLYDCAAFKQHEAFFSAKQVQHKTFTIERVSAELNLEQLLNKCDSKLILIKSKCSRVGSFMELLGLLANLQQGHYHIMVDDLQLDTFWRDVSDRPQIIRNFIQAMKSVKDRDEKNISFWIFCDIAQQVIYENLYMAEKVAKLNDGHRQALKDSFEVIYLEMNLRNTCDISLFLSTMRKRIRDMVQTPMNAAETGHFLRGAVPIFYLVQNITPDLDLILEANVRKLCGVRSIAILHSGQSNVRRDFLSDRNSPPGRDPTQSTVARLQELLLGGPEGQNNCSIVSERIEDCWSAEWPAVIAVLPPGVLFTELYLAVSRARVYCLVILLGTGEDSHMGRVLKEIEKESGACKVLTLKDL